MSKNPTRRAWLQTLTADEIRALRRPVAWRSWVSVLVNWALTAAALALVWAWPHPLTVIPAVFVIGARQLGMGVIMHEAAHRTLFASRRLNDWVGRWLGAYPVLADLDLYRPYHLQHHAKNWTADDPDLGLADKWPVTPASLRRKLLRDITGVTGVKRLVQTFGGAAAAAITGRGPIPRRAALRFLAGSIAANAAIAAALWSLGAGWLYLVWAGAWLTTYSLVTRIRSIAEHACVPDPADELRNTRTVLAGPLERLFIAPNLVHYHLEHHLLMTVPHTNLPELHRMLRDRGALEDACIAGGYGEVLRAARAVPPPPPGGGRAGVGGPRPNARTAS